jgi:collagen type VII alpha
MNDFDLGPFTYVFYLIGIGSIITLLVFLIYGWKTKVVPVVIESGFIPITGPAPPPIGFTGPTGPVGPLETGAGSAGDTGPKGSTGAIGFSIVVDAYGVLTNSLILTIESTQSSYLFSVIGDARPSFSNPVSLSGNQTGNLIYWNGVQWFSMTPFIGAQGPTGFQGTNGTLGPTGRQGIDSLTGPTGPRGQKGDTGTTGSISTFQPNGFLFGEGMDGSLTVENGDTVVLGKDTFCQTVYNKAGGRIFTNGYRLFARQWIRNDGLISVDGQNGGNASDPSRFTQGFGSPTGSMFGGGNGACNSGFVGESGSTGGPSPYAFCQAPYFEAGSNSPTPDSGWPGRVFYNSRFENMSVLDLLVNPSTVPTGFLMPVSGGSGGSGASTNKNGFATGGGGGGAGVMVLCSPITLGSGVLSARGGNAGLNDLGGTNYSSAGGGGLIVVRTIRRFDTWTLLVTGGSSPNPNLTGKDGFVYFC